MTVSTLAGYIHPILMGLALLAALAATHSGLLRAICLHLGKKKLFPWKRHVRFGTWAAALWLLGVPSGLMGAHVAFGVTFFSGAHVTVGCVMLVMAAFALGSGLVLDRVKKRRTLLPALHGCNNIALVALTVWQAVDGFALVQML